VLTKATGGIQGWPCANKKLTTQTTIIRQVRKRYFCIKQESQIDESQEINAIQDFLSFLWEGFRTLPGGSV
jgi:hypothetical protein